MWIIFGLAFTLICFLSRDVISATQIDAFRPLRIHLTLIKIVFCSFLLLIKRTPKLYKNASALVEQHPTQCENDFPCDQSFVFSLVLLEWFRTHATSTYTLWGYWLFWCGRHLKSSKCKKRFSLNFPYLLNDCPSENNSLA